MVFTGLAPSTFWKPGTFKVRLIVHLKFWVFNCLCQSLLWKIEGKTLNHRFRGIDTAQKLRRTSIHRSWHKYDFLGLSFFLLSCLQLGVCYKLTYKAHTIGRLKEVSLEKSSSCFFSDTVTQSKLSHLKSRYRTHVFLSLLIVVIVQSWFRLDQFPDSICSTAVWMLAGTRGMGKHAAKDRGIWGELLGTASTYVALQEPFNSSLRDAYHDGFVIL